MDAKRAVDCSEVFNAKGVPAKRPIYVFSLTRKRAQVPHGGAKLVLNKAL